MSKHSVIFSTPGFAPKIELPSADLDKKIATQQLLIQKQKEAIQRETDKLHSLESEMNELHVQKKQFLAMTPMERMLLTEVHAMRQKMDQGSDEKKANDKDHVDVSAEILSDTIEDKKKEEKREVFDWKNELNNIEKCLYLPNGDLYNDFQGPSTYIKSIIKNLSEQIEAIETKEHITNIYWNSFQFVPLYGGPYRTYHIFMKINLITSTTVYDLQYHREGKPIVHTTIIGRGPHSNPSNTFRFNEFDKGGKYIHLTHNNNPHTPKDRELPYGTFYKFIPILSVSINELKLIKQYITNMKGSLTNSIPLSQNGDHGGGGGINADSQFSLALKMISDRFECLHSLFQK